MLNYFGAAGAVFLKAAGFRAVIAFGFGECCSAPSVCCGASFSSSLLFGFSFSFSFSVSLGAPNLFPLLGCVPFFLSFLYARFFFPFHHLHSLSLSRILIRSVAHFSGPLPLIASAGGGGGGSLMIVSCFLCFVTLFCPYCADRRCVLPAALGDRRRTPSSGGRRNYGVLSPAPHRESVRRAGNCDGWTRLVVQIDQHRQF